MWELLKQAYQVVGVRYPKVSTVFAGIIGFFVFAGVWWLIGRPYDKRIDQRSKKEISQPTPQTQKNTLAPATKPGPNVSIDPSLITPSIPTELEGKSKKDSEPKEEIVKKPIPKSEPQHGSATPAEEPKVLSVPPTETKPDEKKEPTFSIEEAVYTVWIGGKVSREVLLHKTKGMRLADFENSELEAVVEDGKIKISTVLISETGERIDVRKNKITHNLNPEWDINYNDRAIEVVRGDGPYFPYLQIKYTAPKTLVVYGIFFTRRGNNIIILDKSGKHRIKVEDLIKLREENKWPIDRLFEYPRMGNEGKEIKRDE
ncbi:MAG: hypothetical protein MPW16_07200 [Candidatus Manganitrophus sp.]|nr:MAG: hypothetical protein MPW16_07200 [Candidatus Manganitrophus sp.]